MHKSLGTGHYLFVCVRGGGGIFCFSIKEKTWPTPLSPLVIRGDPQYSQSPLIYTPLRSSCSLNEISISCEPVCYSAATSCWCAFLYCYSMTVFIWFIFAFTFITRNKAIVTVTLITVLTNTDGWRKCRFLWSFIIEYCDLLDFVDFLSCLLSLLCSMYLSNLGTSLHWVFSRLAILEGSNLLFFSNLLFHWSIWKKKK